MARRLASCSMKAMQLLDRIIAEKLLTARGVYGFFPANAVGDDVELYADASADKVLERFHFLRQQANEKEASRAGRWRISLRRKERDCPTISAHSPLRAASD